jgi:N-acetylneuraminate epimerase|tara:strand:- start:426 stop:605 length:180 start_codon:yes stop_codon:yes gene_type:complete
MLRNGEWSQVGKLAHGLAYGGSFSLDEGLLIVGGEDSEGTARSDVFVLALQNGELTRID